MTGTVLSPHEPTIKDVMAMLGVVIEKIDDLAVRVTRLEVRMDALEARMDALEARMDALEARMDSLEEQVAHNTVSITMLFGALESQATEIRRMNACMYSLDNRIDDVEDELRSLTRAFERDTFDLIDHGKRITTLELWQEGVNELLTD